MLLSETPERAAVLVAAAVPGPGGPAGYLHVKVGPSRELLQVLVAGGKIIGVKPVSPDFSRASLR